MKMVNKKINTYIYGAGTEYRKLMQYLPKYEVDLDIKGIILTNPSEKVIDNKDVIPLSQLNYIEFDLIIISVLKWREIYSLLKNNNVDDQKIVLGAVFYENRFDVREYISQNHIVSDIAYYRIRAARESEYCKKSMLHYPPSDITIGVGSACPNKCLFCAYHGEDAKGNSEVYNIPYVLSLNDFMRIVDMAKDASVGHVHICATGEPFANPHILDMIDYVISKYNNVTFQTEFWPKLFKEKNYLYEIVKRKDYIPSITTDICSGNPLEHEKIKKGENFQYLMDCLEVLSKEGQIHLKPYMILTRNNWQNMSNIIDEFIRRDIYDFELNVGNLNSYDYSEFTSSNNVYVSSDVEITEELSRLVEYGNKRGIKVRIPVPADMTDKMCSVFWDKFQIWPTSRCDIDKRNDNMIPMACKAVVKGDIWTLGNLFEYSSLMEAWNSETLVSIREGILRGIYPSEYCKECFLYNLNDGYYKQKCYLEE